MRDNPLRSAQKAYTAPPGYPRRWAFNPVGQHQLLEDGDADQETFWGYNFTPETRLVTNCMQLTLMYTGQSDSVSFKLVYFEQLLVLDPQTRQAVIALWRKTTKTGEEQGGVFVLTNSSWPSFLVLGNFAANVLEDPEDPGSPKQDPRETYIWAEGGPYRRSLTPDKVKRYHVEERKGGQWVDKGAIVAELHTHPPGRRRIRRQGFSPGDSKHASTWGSCLYLIGTLEAEAPLTNVVTAAVRFFDPALHDPIDQNTTKHVSDEPILGSDYFDPDKDETQVTIRRVPGLP